MPRGPFGFPRLTSLGPLVEQSEIHPAINLDPGNYSFTKLRHEEGETAHSTLDVIIHDADFRGIHISKSDIHFRYHEMPIIDLINGDTFSRSLLSMMHSFQDTYGEYIFEIPGNGLVIPQVEEQIYNLANGGRSVINEHQLTNVAASYQRYKETDDQRDLREVIEKVSTDFDRVHRINDNIRSERVYWPPTVETDGDENSGLGFGTIDGNHRIVSLSQIIGVKNSIYVWEWINEKELLQQ